MALIGSKKIKTTVVTVDGVEHVIEFTNGLSKVEKRVKRHLLKLNPGLYFDPDNPGVETNFSDDFEAIQYYIAKLKTKEHAPRLCAMIKAEYENLQGDLLSGKYSEKTVEPIKKKVEKDEDEDSEDVDDIVGAGDSIKVKKIKKHHKDKDE